MTQYLKIIRCLTCPSHACAARIWHRIYLTRYCYLMLSNIWIPNLAVPEVLIAAAEQYFLLMCCSSQCAGEFLHWREPCELKFDLWLVREVFDVQDLFFFNVKFISSALWLEFGAMPRALSELRLVQNSPSVQQHHKLCSFLAPHPANPVQSVWPD